MEPNKLYHLYTHANGFENLFKSQENYRYFLQRYQYFTPTVAETLAWCLMPNHLHLLIKIKSEEEIRKAFPQTSKVVNADAGDLRGLGPIEKESPNNSATSSTHILKLLTSGIKDVGLIYSKL